MPLHRRRLGITRFCDEYYNGYIMIMFFNRFRRIDWHSSYIVIIASLKEFRTVFWYFSGWIGSCHKHVILTRNEQKVMMYTTRPPTGDESQGDIIISLCDLLTNNKQAPK